MFTKRFSELSKHDSATAGGKGASLGEMTNAGIPVPPGFVVLASAFEQFLEETDIGVEIDAVLHTVKHTEMHTVEYASEKIQALILSAKMPKDIAGEIQKEFKKLNAEYVAIRSSATAEDSASAAWAGQLDTFLNTTEGELLKNVQKCWASLFTPRAIFYRHEKELHKQKISVAVVVQKMVESEVSGIAFSVHPVTEDRNQLIIEAGFGLGEAIVSGQITPDSYVVEKQPRRILDKNISEQGYFLIRANKQIDGERNEKVLLSKEKGSQQKLSNKQILTLSELIIRIENHYGFPCDIEWAFEKGKFYILQSRPITTLSKGTPVTKADSFELPKPADYDFVFSYGVPYIFSDAHYYAGYAGRDFLLLLQNDTNNLFVGKREHRQLAKEGLEFYTSSDVERNLKEKLSSCKQRVDSIFMLKPKDLSDTGLASALEDAVKLLIEMWRSYFPLEYHSTDSVGKLLENAQAHADFRRKVKRISGLKKEFRKLLNFTLYEPNVVKMFTDEIQKRIPLSYPVANYKYMELISFLHKERISVPDRSVPIVRGLFSNGEDIFGEIAEKLCKEFLSIDLTLSLLKGQTGNKGFYKGKVKKIAFDVKTDFSEEVKDMEKGDVLVSGSTGPEMILACKKAGAIITDEGGIISHAAIISRELDIPCIIGTKIATKVLKDGDMVEVDAERGIVKLVRREVHES